MSYSNWPVGGDVQRGESPRGEMSVLGDVRRGKCPTSLKSVGYVKSTEVA